MLTPAQVIAQNLGALPHPDGAVIQLPGFRTTLLPEGIRLEVNETATKIATAIVHLLESNGYAITAKNSQPTQTS